MAPQDIILFEDQQDPSFLWIDQLESRSNRYRIYDSGARKNIVLLQQDVASIKAGTGIPDTKNTAGSTNSNSKIYLIGALTQSEYAQTYSNSDVYVQNGQIYADNGGNVIGRVLTVEDINQDEVLSDSSTTIPSQAVVKNYIDANTYLNFQGIINDDSDLIFSKIGDVFQVGTDGDFNEIECKTGDLIIAVGGTSQSPIWNFVHTNINLSNFVNDTSGGLQIINQVISHTNSITVPEDDEPQLYPISVDEEGHITELGNPIDLAEIGSSIPSDMNPWPISENGDASPGDTYQYSRANHVHTISSTAIVNALGYTPLNENDYIQVNGVNANGMSASLNSETGYIDISNLIASGSAGVSAGTGLNIVSSEGTAQINHNTNLQNSKSTLGVYPITVDTLGHITSTGNAVNSFGNIQINNGQPVAATTASDTFTLTAGNNITLTQNNKNITIASTGGSGESGITNASISYTDDQQDGVGELTFTLTDAGGGGGSGTDQNVSQVSVSNNINYRLLLSKSDSDNTEINNVNKNQQLTFNPSTGLLTTSKLFLTAESSDEDISVGPNTNRYHSSIGYRYIRVRDSGVDNTPPSENNISTSIVVTPDSFQIYDGWNSSTYDSQRILINKDKIRFYEKNGSTTNSYDVNPTNITKWNNAATVATSANTTATAAKAVTDVIGTHASNNVSKTISSSTTYTAITNFKPAAGTYIVNVTGRFAASTVGRRSICLSTTSGAAYSAVADYNRNTAVVAPAPGGARTVTHFSTIIVANGNTTYYLNMYQDSGGDLECQAAYSYIRIK